MLTDDYIHQLSDSITKFTAHVSLKIKPWIAAPIARNDDDYDVTTKWIDTALHHNDGVLDVYVSYA